MRILQGKHSNYDTDLFTPLLHAIQQVGHRPPPPPYSWLIVGGKQPAA